MSKLTIKDYKLRLILLNEWKLKTNFNETVKKINERFGKDYIDFIKVQEWFDKFNEGDILIFGKDSNLHVTIQNNPIETFNSLLFLSDEYHANFNLLRCDDRFIEYYYRFQGKQFIVLHDLFFNEEKEISREIEILAFNFWRFKMIDDEVSLAFDKHNIHLVKLDYKNSLFISLDSINLSQGIDSILVYQLNPHKFMVFNFGFKFVLGEIRYEKIVLSDVKNYDIGFYDRRLVNNKLQGFDWDNEMESIKFCELNLDTMERNNVDVSIELDEDSLSIKYFNPYCYCWSENCFYAMFWMNDDKHRLFSFNVDELKWTNIQIVASKPYDMFIDSNEVLTLQVGNNKVDAFYRLNLRKPDKLENLAHLSILRQWTLFKNDKYLNYVKRLPIQL